MAFQNHDDSLHRNEKHPIFSSSFYHRQLLQSSGKRKRLVRRIFLPVSLGLLILLVLNLWSTIFSVPLAYASAHPPVVLKGAPSRPNVVSANAGLINATRFYTKKHQDRQKQVSLRQLCIRHICP